MARGPSKMSRKGPEVAPVNSQKKKPKIIPGHLKKGSNIALGLLKRAQSGPLESPLPKGPEMTPGPIKKAPNGHMHDNFSLHIQVEPEKKIDK